MTIFSRPFSPPAVWAALLFATSLTWLAGEFGAPGQGLILTVLALALGKGTLVALDFMELRHAPALWRRLVIGWLLLVITGIVIAYLKG